MKVEFFAVAETELDEAYNWYEAYQKHLGMQFLNEFDSAIKRISVYPSAYALISNDVWHCLIKRLPYGIL